MPHLVPISRGIECTCYAQLREPTRGRAGPRAVRGGVRRASRSCACCPPASRRGRRRSTGQNLCDVSTFVDDENDRLVVVSSIDNLLKGQAGIALQNLNLMLGIEETCGLERIPLYP